MTFWEGRVLAELAWNTIILLPKGKGEYRGIGLVEVIWKMITTIIHNRLWTAIYLHDALHS